MIRGTGDNFDQVFVDSFKLKFQFDESILDLLAPEGVPFIGGLGFDLKKSQRKTVAVPKIVSYYGYTSELIKFEGCPWSIKRKNMWEDEPDYVNKPNFDEVQLFPVSFTNVIILTNCF